MNKKVALSVLSATVFASMAASAFAAPKSGLYIGGEVDKFYSFDTLFDATDATMTQFTSEIGSAGFSNLIYVDFDGRGASLQEIMDSTDFNSVKKDLTADKFEGEYANIKADGSEDGKYDPRKDAIDTAGELKVDSVEVVNASQVVVKFNQKVDKATAEAVASYKVNGVNTSATPELNEDGKSVTLTFGTSQNNSSFTLLVTGVKTEDKKTTVTDFTQVVTFKDTVAPTVSKSEFAVNGDLEVTFSEPLLSSATPIVRVKGVPVTATVSGSKVVVTAAALTTANVSVAGGETAAIFVAGVKDTAGNEMAIYNGSVTKTVDAVKPTISSITQTGQNTVRVVFSEKLGTTTSDLAAGEFKFLKGTTVYNSTGATKYTADTTGKTYDVTFNVADIYGTPAADSATVTLLLAKDDVKDVAGNGIEQFTQTFTFNADKTGPSFVSSAVATDKQTFELTFNEEIGTTIDNSKIVVTDANGVRFQVLSASKKGTTNGDEKVLVVDVVSGTAQMTNGTYTVQLVAGAVKDTQANSSAAATTTVVVGDATDITKPEVTLDTTNSGVNKFVLNFSEEVTASALDKANYKLDGAVLPADSAIYFNSTAKNSVTIELPAESINYGNSATGTSALLNVSNVADKAGNKLDSKNLTVTVGDNTAAVLQSAALAGDQLTLTFSENLDASSISGLADLNDTFKVLGGTTQLSATSATYSVSGNKLYVTYSGGNWSTVKAESTVTVETYATPVLEDANDLEVKGSVKVNVAK